MQQEEKNEEFVESSCIENLNIDEAVSFGDDLSFYSNDTYEDLSIMGKRIVNILMKNNSQHVKKFLGVFDDIYEENKYPQKGICKFLIKKND